MSRVKLDFEDLFLLRKEVASFLGVSEKTLQNWASDGIGPPLISKGRVVRYPKKEFFAWYTDANRKGKAS